MIFNLLNTQFLIFYILFFVPSLVIHEFSHALIAYRLGDPTAKNMGRLSLNPLVHLDIFGTLAIFLIGFGWAKPVPINPYNFQNVRRDSSLVSLAGPIANLIIAGICLLLFRFLGLDYNSLLFNVISIIMQVNIILGIFNLIPLGPLDGFKIVSGLLPTNLAIQWEEANQYTYILLIILLILPIGGQTVIGRILETISNFAWQIIF